MNLNGRKSLVNKIPHENIYIDWYFDESFHDDVGNLIVCGINKISHTMYVVPAVFDSLTESWFYVELADIKHNTTNNIYFTIPGLQSQEQTLVVTVFMDGTRDLKRIEMVNTLQKYDHYWHDDISLNDIRDTFHINCSCYDCVVLADLTDDYDIDDICIIQEL